MDSPDSVPSITFWTKPAPSSKIFSELGEGEGRPRSRYSVMGESEREGKQAASSVEPDDEAPSAVGTAQQLQKEILLYQRGTP